VVRNKALAAGAARWLHDLPGLIASLWNVLEAPADVEQGFKLGHGALHPLGIPLSCLTLYRLAV